MKRVTSIDIARGLVMIIMAIDHARDLLHIDSLTQSPTDLATTTPLLFFTRWITHLCHGLFTGFISATCYLAHSSSGDPQRDQDCRWRAFTLYGLVSFCCSILCAAGMATITRRIKRRSGFGICRNWNIGMKNREGSSSTTMTYFAR